jgi:glutamate-1-semialdehyde aminotransferase
MCAIAQYAKTFLSQEGRYRMNDSTRVPRSLELYRRALELIPGGTQLVSRRPNRFAYGASPIYAQRAQGARFWDVDGHEYIDWVSGIGAIILGYADPVVDEAVQEQIARGTMTSINHELEIELAEVLASTIPCAEMVRYAKCGGEACAMAVRIARGATSRDKVLFCGYHGWHDWYLAANLSAEASLNAHLFPGIEPIGVPRGLAGTAIPFPYSDAAALGQLLDDHRGQVAAVVMEPLRSSQPPQGYLQSVAQLTYEHGAVLVFDEVSAGFRFGLSAAQGYVGVTPDVAVFAKSVSNGYPMGFVVGKREVMQHAAEMFISSTYWSDTIGLRATLTTLAELRRRDVPRQLWRFGGELKRRLNQVAEQIGAPVCCQGLDVHPHLRFEVDDPAMQKQAATLYIQEMAKRGCHGLPSFYLNAAQGDAELEQTIAAAREAFTLVAEAVHSNAFDRLLECDLQQESFRRLVR